MFDSIKKKFSKKPEPKKRTKVELTPEQIAEREAKKAERAAKKVKFNNDPKNLATLAGEPYVNVVKVDIDPENPGNGAFELDFNDIFVARLVKAGYKGRDDAQIVDQWFQDICRNVLAENYEQWEANQGRDTRAVVRKDLGDGRTEVS